MNVSIMKGMFSYTRFRMIAFINYENQIYLFCVTLVGILHVILFNSQNNSMTYILLREFYR